MRDTNAKTIFKNLLPVGGVIFDMDGTMVDNMMVHHMAWQEVLHRYGLDLTLDEVKAQIHGINHQILERLFGDRFTEKERSRISEEKENLYRERFDPQANTVPGLVDFLDQLDQLDIPMAIATAAPIENVEFVLDQLRLSHYFTSLVHAGHVQKGKPDPEVFLSAARHLQRDPEHCLVFEDSPTGAEASQRAGCKTIILTTTHSAADFKDIPSILYFINDFTELV